MRLCGPLPWESFRQWLDAEAVTIHLDFAPVPSKDLIGAFMSDVDPANAALLDASPTTGKSRRNRGCIARLRR